MRNSMSGLILFVIVMGTTLTEAAPGGPYLHVAGGGGGAWNQESDQDIGIGPVVLGALGWKFDGFRLEGEVSWRKNPIELTRSNQILGIPVGGDVDKRDSHLTNLAWMVNMAYDFTSAPLNGLFVLGGVGASRVEVEQYGPSDTFFAFQGGAGWRFQVTDRVAMSLSYRVFGTPSPALDLFESESIDNVHHNGLFGLTASF